MKCLQQIVKLGLQLKCSRICIRVAGTASDQNPTFQINDTKICVRAITLSTQENINNQNLVLKEQLSGINVWLKQQIQHRYLDYLIDPSFQVANRLFVLSFEDDDGGENHKQYNLPTVEIKDYNVMINGRNFFDQPIKDDFKTFDDMRKISTGQGDYYTVGCLLDYPYFKKCYKLIAIDLSK